MYISLLPAQIAGDLVQKLWPAATRFIAVLNCFGMIGYQIAFLYTLATLSVGLLVFAHQVLYWPLSNTRETVEQSKKCMYSGWLN